MMIIRLMSTKNFVLQTKRLMPKNGKGIHRLTPREDPVHMPYPIHHHYVSPPYSREDRGTRLLPRRLPFQHIDVSNRHFTRERSMRKHRITPETFSSDKALDDAPHPKHFLEMGTSAAFPCNLITSQLRPRKHQVLIWHRENIFLINSKISTVVPLRTVLGSIPFFSFPLFCVLLFCVVRSSFSFVWIRFFPPKGSSPFVFC